MHGSLIPITICLLFQLKDLNNTYKNSITQIEKNHDLTAKLRTFDVESLSCFN